VEVGVGSVGSEVIGFGAVCKPLLNAVNHAADHGEGDLGCLEEVAEY
jgi:hypothetical protein